MPFFTGLCVTQFTFRHKSQSVRIIAQWVYWEKMYWYPMPLYMLDMLE